MVGVGVRVWVASGVELGRRVAVGVGSGTKGVFVTSAVVEAGVTGSGDGTSGRPLQADKSKISGNIKINTRFIPLIFIHSC